MLEFSGIKILIIFNSHNSIQINIKFKFPVQEYIIVYEYI